MAELQEAFYQLGAFVAKYDPIALLSQLTATFLFVPAEEFQGEASEVVKWERWIEFLAGYLLVRPYPLDRVAEVDGGTLERVEKLLDEYFGAILLHMAPRPEGPTGVSEEAQLLEEAKIESLYVRGDAYPHQYYIFARQLYEPHDAWFRSRYGFTIGEAVQLSQAIDRLCNNRFNESLRQAREEARRQTDELIARQEVTEADRRDVEMRIGVRLHFGNSESSLAFTSQGLSRFAGLPIQTCQNFLDRMSQRFDYRDENFPNSFTDAAAAPWDYNTLNERPIVRRADEHWLFVPPLLRSALFATFHFDFLRDKEYLPTYEKARGKLLESQTAECLRRVFPRETVLLNPHYPSGEEMADVMVLHDHKVLLVQCKSKALTYAARTGADFRALRSDLQKAIADAFKQASRAKRYLQGNKEPRLIGGESVLTIDMAKINGLHIISVTPMPFQTFAARFANTNAALKLFSGGEYPWSLSLGDLDIVTQVLASPAQFLHYLMKRQEVEQTPFKIHAHEIDYLGLYLSQGMQFSVDMFKGINGLGLAGMSSDIDRWVFERLELGRPVVPPRSPMPDGFSEFLADVERARNNYAIDCALSLLDLGAQGRMRFMELVGQTKELSRQDKSLHSFSAILRDGKCGHSFLSYDAAGDYMQLFSQTAAFAMLKKYQSKCDQWVGLGWDLTSARMVDVAFFVSQPWSYDERMEQLVREELRPGRRIEI
ncbi:MAG TPA: hypothetical protein VEJ47_17625 [Candidatus Eremiobacteraceae bacterium]|nr:hypothetical protein [Candidatus Eremiobacteraceae bacterium]